MDIFVEKGERQEKAVKPQGEIYKQWLLKQSSLMTRKN